MNSPITYPSIDDKDLDDAALWAVIDSAAAAASSTAVSKYRKPLVHKNSPIVPFPIASPSPPQSNKTSRNFHNNHDGGEVLNHHPQKISRPVNDMSPEMAVVKHVQRTPSVTHYSSPETRKFNSPVGSQCSPVTGMSQEHSLTGRFPTVSLFKEYQNAAMAILEKSDYTMISGSPFIKKAGWRKISFYFNLSYEIKDKTIEFDEDRNVLRAEFIVRAYMQGGRFSDGWGSCERREKRFLKPNHDIPSTAETRAKNKACQDLLGIGEYRPGVSQSSAHR